MKQKMSPRLHWQRLVFLIGMATLVSAQSGAPAISAGGVVSASAFGGFTSVAPGSWIEIYGSNLAVDSRGWAGTDFSGVNAPTSLDGTSVTIGGEPAFIDYVSPGQVNAQVPSNVGTGLQPLVVTLNGVASSPYSIMVNAVQPGLLAPASFNIGGTQYAAALFSDGVTYVLPPGSPPGVASRRAQPGDTITLYGIGFGPVVPSVQAGQVVQQSNSLASSFQLNFGSVLAEVTYDGLAPNEVGLYQFDVTVPSVATSDAVPLTFTLGGMSGSQTMYLAVANGSDAGVQVQSLTLSAASVAGGGTVQGTVTLSAPAPAGGAVVTLFSNSSSASVPATVTVPAGSTSATFTITASSVSSNQAVTIGAAYGGGSGQAALAVTVGGGLSQFTLIYIEPIYVINDQKNYGGGIDLMNLGQSSYQLNSSFGGALFPSSTQPCLLFGVFFNQVSVTGQTITLSGVQVGSGSIMEGENLMLYAITAGSMTITLSPNGAPGVGSVAGTFTLTSSLTILTGTISGSYLAN